MTGQPIRGGTAFADILLDEVAVMRLQQNLPPVANTDYDDEVINEEEFEANLYTNPNDLCSTSRLKMNMVLPNANIEIDDEYEEDIQISILQTNDLEKEQ
jgi:hypothetical protein